jgi:hypothetical protein
MTYSESNRFFQVPYTGHATSEGEVRLPIAYYDVSNVVAMFWGDRAGAERIVNAAGLELALTRGDKALVALSFYQYRRTTVGVYNEVGVAVFCVPPGRRPSRLGAAELYAPLSWRTVGAYVVDLPVTTAAANAAGRELWGYPKFITEIPFHLAGREVDSAVLAPGDGSPLCQLAGTMGRGVPVPPMSLVTYTRLDGALIRTQVRVRGRANLRSPGTTRLRVGTASHPMAANLRTLGLADARPFSVLETTRFQSLLYAGRPIAEAPTMSNAGSSAAGVSTIRENQESPGRAAGR